MKNILFATTALVASAGFASAEVTVTGFAEMGIIGGEAIVENDNGTIGFGDDFFEVENINGQFHTDIDVTFTMSGVADNGLTFGASVDLDEADDSLFGGSLAFGNTTQGGETIFVSFGAATLTMGDTNGAFDQAMREVNYAGGSINDDEEHIAFGGYGNNGLDGTYDGQIARFDYAFSGVTASLSAEVDDFGDSDPVWGVGVRYSGSMSGVDLGVGVGYQTVNVDTGGGDFTTSIVGVSVDAGFSNGVTAGFTYTQADFDGTDGSHGAVGLAYEMNALAIGVNYGHYVLDGDETVSGFGLAASYDLGGGLVAQFGYGNSTAHDVFFTNAAQTETDDLTYNTYSLGLAMSF